MHGRLSAIALVVLHDNNRSFSMSLWTGFINNYFCLTHVCFSYLYLSFINVHRPRVVDVSISLLWPLMVSAPGCSKQHMKVIFRGTERGRIGLKTVLGFVKMWPQQSFSPKSASRTLEGKKSDDQVLPFIYVWRCLWIMSSAARSKDPLFTRMLRFLWQWAAVYDM